MVQKTRHCTTNYRMLKPFIQVVNDNDGYFKFKSSGFMDLSMEKLYYTDVYGFPVYSITHYGEQNGDLMADPEITFSITSDGRLIPQTFRNDYVGVYQKVFQERYGIMLYSQSLLKELDDFLWHWLQNLQEQGFTANVV